MGEIRFVGTGETRGYPYLVCKNRVEPQWLEHLWGHENMFGTGVVRANEC